MQAIKSIKKKKVVQPTDQEIPALGSRRIRKAWTALNELMHSTADYNAWLSVLFDLMMTPQYAQVKYTKFSSKTGKPLEFSWVPDPSSMSKSFTYYPRTDTKLPKELCTNLDALLKQLEKSKLPVLYTTPYKDSVDTAKIRRIVVYRDYIQTGGGHNDSPSYTYALVFSPIVDEEEVLTGY